jgi:hypothetical protein
MAHGLPASPAAARRARLRAGGAHRARRPAWQPRRAAARRGAAPAWRRRWRARQQAPRRACAPAAAARRPRREAWASASACPAPQTRQPAPRQQQPGAAQEPAAAAVAALALARQAQRHRRRRPPSWAVARAAGAAPSLRTALGQGRKTGRSKPACAPLFALAPRQCPAAAAAAAARPTRAATPQRPPRNKRSRARRASSPETVRPRLSRCCVRVACGRERAAHVKHCVCIAAALPLLCARRGLLLRPNPMAPLR